ncbi:MAG TPA: MFS transporter [Chitinophagaceae bacterium]|nr:MFS transporter [Chitinophagaceae bacterium]
MQKAWLVRLLYFLVFCCTASWLPVLADFCRSRELSGTETSLILSITPLMMFLIQPVYGAVADRFGYKKCLIFSSLLASISFLGYLLQGSFMLLALVTVMMSIFYNTIQPVLDSISLKLAAADPDFSYGTLRTAGAAGWAFTGILTGYVIDGISINAIFIISSASLFLVFLFSFLLKAEHEKMPGSDAFVNTRTIIRDPALAFLLLCVFLVSTGATTIWNFYSLYMKENGASATLVGYGLSFQGLCEIPLFYFSSRIIFKLGLKRTLVLTVMATVIRLLLYSVVGDPVYALPIELLHGLSWSLFWVACVEYVSRLVDPAWLATGQSLLYAAYFGAGAIAGNYWTGWLYDHKFRLSEIFLLNAGIVMVVAVLLAFFLKTKDRLSVA